LPTYPSFFSERLGLRVGATEDELQHLTLLIEIRNLLVHNRGIVNAIFLAKTQSIKWEVGQKVTIDAFDKGLIFSAQSVAQLDIEACSKFDLTRAPGYLASL
jgi:hypothetical protein